MLVPIDKSGLGRTKGYEHLIRFVFGGIITVLRGLIGAKFGPVIAGLFLAFPAIFPASATLVAKHQRERKHQIGLQGDRRASYVAADDALGVAIGSIGLVGFALTCWLCLPRYPAALVLAGAMAVWMLTAGSTGWCANDFCNAGSKQCRARKNMPDLTSLSLQLDAKKSTCRAIIETPKGSRNKFDYDPDSNLFMLGGLLPEGMMFPFDFGFLPSTLGDDGDPLDILVLMDAPAHVGCLIDVRIIGIINARQTEDGKTETNDRLLGVAIHSYEHEDLKSIDDARHSLLAQLEEFFVSYNKQRGKKFRITGTGGPKKAVKFLKTGIQAHKKAKSK